MDALKKAFAAHLKTGAELLTEWKAGLSDANAAVLSEHLQRGLRLGLALTMPKDRWQAQIFLVDAAGETAVLETIEQTGAINRSVN